MGCVFVGGSEDWITIDVKHLWRAGLKNLLDLDPGPAFVYIRTRCCSF